MLFDGVGAFAEASLVKTDCLQDPEQCQNGFSMGAKLKLDEAVMSYKMPKYIVDSGARSLTTRGVSVYIVNGNLIFELATAKKAWKVSYMRKTSLLQLNLCRVVMFFIDNLGVFKNHETLGPPQHPFNYKLTRVWGIPEVIQDPSMRIFLPLNYIKN